MRSADAIEPLVFAVPHTGFEILCMRDGDRWKGGICEPRKISTPVPWLSTCSHCIARRERSLPLAVRRAVSLLCSRRTDLLGEEYRLSNGLRIFMTRTENAWQFVIHHPKEPTVLDVTCETGKQPRFRGETTKFRSPMLKKALKTLLSVRTPSEYEIIAYLRPMRKLPRRRILGRHIDCKMLRW